MSAEKDGAKAQDPTDVDLANYAKAYMGAYISAVQSESPERPPIFYTDYPYSVEICYMPNGSVCMLFDKSDQPTISVASQNWDYVMGRIMSGIRYLTTLYPGDGLEEEDAIARGRKDAIRDIRAIESSDIAEATRQLETVISELSDINQWNRNPTKMAELAVRRLDPIRRAIQRAGPMVDMMSMVDGVRRYPEEPPAASLDREGLSLLSAVSQQIGDLTEMLKMVKTQGERIHEIEAGLRGEVHEFKTELDKKMAKGLGVILTTTDRKIDKAIASMEPGPVDNSYARSVKSLREEVNELREAVEELQLPAEDEGEEDMESEPDARFDEIGDEILGLKTAIQELRTSVPEIPVMPAPEVPAELVLNIESLRGEVSKLSSRVKRIEQYLTAISAARRSR